MASSCVMLFFFFLHKLKYDKRFLLFFYLWGYGVFFVFFCKLPSSVVQPILSTCRLLCERPLIGCRFFFFLDSPVFFFFWGGFIRSCCGVKANNIVCNVKSLPVALHLCTLHTRKYLPLLLSFFQLLFFLFIVFFFFFCVCMCICLPLHRSSFSVSNIQRHVIVYLFFDLFFFFQRSHST